MTATFLGGCSHSKLGSWTSCCWNFLKFLTRRILLANVNKVERPQYKHRFFPFETIKLQLFCWDIVLAWSELQHLKLEIYWGFEWWMETELTNISLIYIDLTFIYWVCKNLSNAFFLTRRFIVFAFDLLHNLKKITLGLRPIWGP